MTTAAAPRFDESMQLYRRKPPTPLDEFIDVLWLFDGFTQAHQKERLMPDGSMALVINLHEDCTRIYERRDISQCRTYNGCIVTGAQSEYFVLDTAEQLHVAGVGFKPGGAFPFLGPPAGELQDLHVPLDALWGSTAAELRDRLLAASTVEQRFRVMEQVLLGRLRRPFERHPAVRFALGHLNGGPQMKSIGEITERTGLSPRRFIELFRREVGLTPKLYCRVRRFQQALRLIAAGRPVDWAAVALDAGYFDQPHFIHDFRAFSGINPSAYAESRPRYINHVPIR